MRRALLAALGIATLALVWSGPLMELIQKAFTRHMTVHMAVVAVAAPLLALALAGGRADPGVRWPVLVSPILVSLLELGVVWTWHAPALHHAAQSSTAVLVMQQLSFLVVGLLLWLSVLGGDHRGRDARRGLGAVVLLFTSMHMTLLGALLGLAQRPVYQLHDASAAIALDDQQLGGTIMLIVGGIVFLGGGLALVGGVLQRQVAGTRA